MASGIGGMAINQPILGYDSNDDVVVTSKVNPISGVTSLFAGDKEIQIAGGITPSSWLATQEFSNPVNYTGAGATFAARRSVALPFTGGRLIAYSSGVAPIADCNYAVGTAVDASIAVQATGFVVPTWGNGKAGPVAAGMWGGTLNAEIVEFALSDPFVLASVARTDGGSGHIVEARTFVNTGVTSSYSLAIDILNAKVELITSGGPAYSGASKAGDYVTTNQAGFTIPGHASNYTFVDLILFSDNAIYTVAAGGDSISKGQATPDARNCDIKQACDALTLAGIANVAYMQHTRPGKGIDSIGASDINFINAIKPNIFFYTPYTPNDTGLDVTATLNKTKNWLNAVKQACDAAGTVLVICSSTPWLPFNASQSNADLAYVASLEALTTKLGLQFHDRYAKTTNGAVPAGLLPGYAYPTGTTNQQAHPNDACYAMLSPYVQDIIRGLIGK